MFFNRPQDLFLSFFAHSQEKFAQNLKNLQKQDLRVKPKSYQILRAKLRAKVWWLKVLRSMDTISDRIAALRGKQARRPFAEKIGITESTLRNYEKGTSLPDAQILQNICHILRISPQWLLFGTGPMEQKSETEDIQSSPTEEITRYVKLERELDSEKKERRNLADENRQLYRRCLEQEKLIGELRLALQAARGEGNGTDVPVYAQSAPLSSLHNNE